MTAQVEHLPMLLAAHTSDSSPRISPMKAYAHRTKQKVPSPANNRHACSSYLLPWVKVQTSYQMANLPSLATESLLQPYCPLLGLEGHFLLVFLQVVASNVHAFCIASAGIYTLPIRAALAAVAA